MPCSALYFNTEKDIMYFLQISVSFLMTIFATVHCGGAVPKKILNNGYEIPGLGLGTWLGYDETKTDSIRPVGDEVERAVEWAIDAGYRLFDTAWIYHTEEQKNGSLCSIDYLETWQGMVQEQGLVRSIGVSNFNQQQLERLLSKSSVKPAVLQNEVNLNQQTFQLLSFCRRNNITVIAYSPIKTLFYATANPGAPPPRVDDPRIESIAKAHNKTVPQVVLRYLMKTEIEEKENPGVIPIPKSLNRCHIQDNIKVFDFCLTEKDRSLPRSFNKYYMTQDISVAKESPYYPYDNPIL